MDGVADDGTVHLICTCTGKVSKRACNTGCHNKEVVKQMIFFSQSTVNITNYQGLDSDEKVAWMAHLVDQRLFGRTQLVEAVHVWGSECH
jgi:hypothetical protein